LPEQVAQPEYATAVGLILYGQKRGAMRPPHRHRLEVESMFAGA